MPLTLPYPGSPATSSLRDSKPIRDNFQAIADKFNAGIVDADISTGANIQGSKLLLRGVPGDRLALASISVLELIDNAVETAKIKDLNVTPAKLSVNLGTDKLQVTVVKQAIAAIANPGSTGTVFTPVASFPRTTYDLIGLYLSNIAGTAGNTYSIEAREATADWTATFRSKDTGGVVSGDATWIFLKKTSA